MPRIAEAFTKRLAHAKLRVVSADYLATTDGLSSGRARLEGLTQFALLVAPAVPANDWNGTTCRIGYARRRFLRYPVSDRSQIVDSKRRDVRVVEGARLESVCRGNSTVGSNPTLSANYP